MSTILDTPHLEFTDWFPPEKYPRRKGTYELQVKNLALLIEIEGKHYARLETLRTHFDGLDWVDLPDEYVVVQWRGLTQDPLADL